jgi:hypothetical protein
MALGLLLAETIHNPKSRLLSTYVRWICFRF